jgi:hypothetical protein
LETALEFGWIGLILELGFYTVVMIFGIKNFFELKDPVSIMINLVLLVPFFAMTIANYTQHAMPYKPIFIVILAAYAAIIKLKELNN